MAAAPNPVPQSQQESKSAKKKKAKAEASAKGSSVPPDSDTGAVQPPMDAPTNGADGAYESPYLKELYKYVLLRLLEISYHEHWLMDNLLQKYP
jgi:hypothetical protein